MTLLLDGKIYISKIWFLHAPGTKFDVLMHLARPASGLPWKLHYRFRYYKDAKTFDSEDVKSAWSVTFPNSMDENGAVKAAGEFTGHLNDIIREMGIDGDLKWDVTDIDSSDPAEIIAKMKVKPQFFVRKEGMDEPPHSHD